MKHFEKTDIVRILFSFLVSTAPAVYFTIKLNPEGPLVPVALFIVVINMLYFFKSKLEGTLLRVSAYVIFTVLFIAFRSRFYRYYHYTLFRIPHVVLPSTR